LTVGAGVLATGADGDSADAGGGGGGGGGGTAVRAGTSAFGLGAGPESPEQPVHQRSMAKRNAIEIAFRMMTLDYMGFQTSHRCISLPTRCRLGNSSGGTDPVIAGNGRR
jgi:hypothetical protein